MNETLHLFLAWLAGGALGLFFFGGLWWTVRSALASKRPASWILIGWLLRFGPTLAGFYWIAGADWHRMLACLMGFILVRQIAARKIRPPNPSPTRATSKEHHAS